MGRNQSLQDGMQSHRTLIENTLSTPAIQDEVAIYGYAVEKMNDGKTLLDETTSLFTNRDKEIVEKENATAGYNQLRDKIDKQFARDIKLARVALRENPTLLRSHLGVKELRSSVYTEWKLQVKQFYSNALGNEDIKAKLTTLNITEESMNSQLTQLNSLEELYLTQKKEIGEAQVATEERDKKLVELERWCADYRAVARIVFEDNPQMLEILGIIVK